LFHRPGQDINKQATRLSVGACLPHGQEVFGNITLHILVTKHQFPNGVTPTAGIDIRE
jgi:hypothetical protein